LQIQNPLAEQEPAADGSSMQANGTPQHPSIAIALFSEHDAEQSETTKEQKQFQAGEVKPGVHKLKITACR